MTPAPHDRPLNPTRSAIIKRAFDVGAFRTCEWASAYCAETKTTYRVNGKHTSTVLTSMNGSLPKNLSIVVEQYHCDTLEDVAALYATFDTRSSVRTTGDINMCYASAVAGLREVPAKIINTVVCGLAYALWEDQYKWHPVEERAALILEAEEFCLWVESLIAGQSNEKHRTLCRLSVVAAMRRTWLKSKQAASDFWVAVRDETGVKPDLPDRKLGKFLSQARLANRNNAVAGVSVGTREMYVKCIHGWNAWRDHRTTTELRYHANSDTPNAK